MATVTKPGDVINVTDTMPDPVPMDYQPAPIGDVEQRLPTTVVGGGLRGQSAPNQTFAPASGPSTLGKIAKKLFTGSETNYSYDENGNLVTTQTPMKPGSLFRHIVAGALLGGALGSQDPRHTFSGGFAAGSAGVLQDEERKDLIRRKQAQDAQEMRLKSQQSLREQEKLNLEKQKMDLEKREQENKDMLAKAQNAFYTSEVLRNNVLSQGASLDQHIKGKDFFAPTVGMFKSMGLQPEFEVTESQAKDFLAKRPDAAKLTPVVTDVKMGIDANGNPTHEYVYGLYNLDQEVKIPGPVKEMWKSIGFDKTHPEYFAPNAKMSANSFKAAQQQALTVFNDQIEQKKGQFGLEHLQAQTKAELARAKHYLMATAQGSAELKKDQNLQQAMADFEKSGHDISKMKPELKPYIMNLANQELANKNAMYKAAITDAEKEEMINPQAAAASRQRATQIAKEMSDLDTLTDIFSKAKEPTPPVRRESLPKPADPKDAYIRGEFAQKVVAKYVEAYGAENAVAEMLKNGFTTTEPAGPGFIEKTLPYVQDWFGGREKYQKK